MTDVRVQYFASDKDIHDIMLSAKQRVTERILLELALDRGIIYSAKTDRATLVNDISMLPHDFHDLQTIAEKSDQTHRAERTTSVTLQAAITIDDLKNAAEQYEKSLRGSETTAVQRRTKDTVSLDVAYDEYDFSRTSLAQKQPRDSRIDFVQREGRTVVRMPANEKTKQILDEIIDIIEKGRKHNINRERIEVDHISNADDRTRFFTSLISGIPGYKLHTTVNVRVDRLSDESSDEVDLESQTIAESEMLAYVRSVAMRGTNLIAAREYQNLLRSGFFITSITWQSDQINKPNDRIQFFAAFEGGASGVGFKYGLKFATRKSDGSYVKTFRPLPDDRLPSMLELLETAATTVLAGLGVSKVTSNIEAV